MMFNKLFHKLLLLVIVVWQHLGVIIPDKLYLKVLFRLKMGKRLNLDNPKTFSEKQQWLKLYDHNSEYTKMVDKLAVKDYVASIIGKEYIIPTIGVWDRPDDIELDKLPNKFVLKTTHGGGSCGVVICSDKKRFSQEDAIKILNHGMRQNIYHMWREWPYKNVPKRIIAEKFIEPSLDSEDLPDYKFFCFNGKPKYCQVITGRSETMSIDFFDRDWNHQPFHEPRNYPFAKYSITKPRDYDLMWDLAEKIASGLVFSRIDFYQAQDQVYFGEITFYPTSGMGGFNPETYDFLLGKMINLPMK